MDKNYYYAGFGKQFFEDIDYAFKLILTLIMERSDYERLYNLMAEVEIYNSIGGDPGWEIIKKRFIFSSEYYVDWPKDAMYKVDFFDYELYHPIRWYTESEFNHFVYQIVKGCLEFDYIKRDSIIDKILAIVSPK